MLENLTALHRAAILLWTEHLLTSLQNLTREELISYISGEVSEVIFPKATWQYIHTSFIKVGMSV